MPCDGADSQFYILHSPFGSQPDLTFAERMVRYHTRLYDVYRRDIVSLAILGDERRSWRPRRFRYARWGCAVSMTFPAFKLLDYDLEELANDPNPCAIVILAHRTAQATRRDPDGRAAAKFALTRRLYERGYDATEIRRLYRFIDWLLRLPPALDRETWHRIAAFEKERDMPYVTFAERYGIEQGLEQGLEQGRAEGILTAIASGLKRKFGAEGQELLPQIRRLNDLPLLEAILDRLWTATTLDEVRAVYTSAEGGTANEE